MQDPTRIPRVLDRLRDAWEGQPDLPLATLFGILANRGAGWGTTDEELEQLLIVESLTHPSELPRDDDGCVADDFLVETLSPDQRVTLTKSGEVVVRSGDGDRQPSVWHYSSVRPTGPGRMLTVMDGEGLAHRLGIVTLISQIKSTTDEDADEDIEGLERAEIGNHVWLAVLADGSRVLITQRLHLWTTQRRTVTKTTHAWNQIVRCRVGEEFVYVSGGGETVGLGIVDKLLLVES